MRAYNCLRTKHFHGVLSASPHAYSLKSRYGKASVHLTGGYCWPTPQDRNWHAQHACFEGKKAQETFTRKSTSRTLKEVDQQYPGVIRVPAWKNGFDHARHEWMLGVPLCNTMRVGAC